MKKLKSLSLLFIVSIMIISFVVPCFAASQYIYDDLDYISETNQGYYEQMIENLSEKTGYYIAVEFNENGVSDEIELQDYADKFLMDHAPNFDAETTPAIILIVDMEFRGYHISTHGSALDLYNDSRISAMKSDIQNQLANEEYDEAVEYFLYDIELYYDEDNMTLGQRFVHNLKSFWWLELLVLIIVPLIILLVIRHGYKFYGKAGEYNLSKNSKIKMINSNDTLIDKKVIVTSVPKDSGKSGGSSSGGSSSHSGSSGGGSFGGGGGRF